MAAADPAATRANAWWRSRTCGHSLTGVAYLLHQAVSTSTRRARAFFFLSESAIDAFAPSQGSAFASSQGTQTNTETDDRDPGISAFASSQGTQTVTETDD